LRQQLTIKNFTFTVCKSTEHSARTVVVLHDIIADSALVDLLNTQRRSDNIPCKVISRTHTRTVIC